MKKFKFLIFTLLLILPFSVKANVGLPHFHGYDAFVSNPNGAKLYKDDNLTDEVGILEYKSNLRVLYERVINEEIYVILDDDADDYDYNYVLLKDITRTTNDYEITKNKRHTYYAFKDINLYEGPSLSFEVIDTIPKGTEITLENSVDAIWWEYTYNGKKGYILYEGYWNSPCGLATTNASFFADPRDKKLLALNDITEGFTDPSNPTDENKINIKIPKGTVLEFNSNDYICPVLNTDYDMTDLYYYVTYNDKSAWISSDNFATDLGYDLYIISTKNILTNKDYQNEKWSEKTMTRFHPYKVLYEGNYSWYLIEIDGENYWVDRAGRSVKDFEWIRVDDVIEVEIKKRISLYDYDKTKIGTLEPGLYKVYNIVDSSWCFVEENGYIKKSSVNFIEKTDTSTNKNITNQTDEKFKKLDSMEIVLYCTDAAIVLAVISVVTIILIKKKKNKKLMTTESVENSLITEQTTEVSNDNNLQE